MSNDPGSRLGILIERFFLSFFLDEQTKLLQSILQCPQRDPQSFSCLPSIPLEFLEGLYNDLLFPIFENTFRFLWRKVLFQQFSRQLIGGYFPSGKNNAPFDDVLKLPNITGPSVELQKVQCFIRYADWPSKFGCGRESGTKMPN